MKHLLVTLMTLSLTLPSFAGVKEDVRALSSMVYGHNMIQSKGKNALEVLRNYIIDRDGEVDEDRMRNKEVADMDWGDEIEEGFTSARSADQMGGFAQGYMEEQMEYAEGAELKKLKANFDRIQKNWEPLIKKLERQGVKFGYNGNGPGYCGVSFIQLLIIDPKEQKVYEVHLSGGGEC